MGDEIPHQPYSNRSDRPVDTTLAKIIDECEQLIAQREREKALIREESLLRRIRKLGQVWDLNYFNRLDRGLIDAAIERAGGRYEEPLAESDFPYKDRPIRLDLPYGVDED